MNSCCCSLSYTWIISFLIPIFTFACEHFTVSIITTLVLVSSAFLFLIHSKHNLQVLEQQDQQPYQEDDQNDVNQVTEAVKKGCFDVGSPDSCSESEVIDQFSCTTEEDSDFDGWQFSGEVYRRPDCSDGSISDEESLIEIALPGGHYVGYQDVEEPKFCCRQRSPESVLWWPEMNEEENMIEIDLSVGSIKCSRFEIKA
ncbi:unnamed protein product [Lactuca virosa]|uniref:Uncharacterized protein n=1 Tax=Lactuca virosa TaxID=75947 RepID=A0AAU9N5Z3_9ASTR|nr:unnamed protein product [Lactuca virosa]